MYKPTIGLEVHVELLTESKLFCGCKNDPSSAETNMHVCPVCIGYPGALPYINKKAIEHVLRIGAALGGDLASDTKFDRKHYFYPDIPKGYQISQYEHPLVKHAMLLDVGIQRIHLEEDTAKSSHDVCTQGSAIDFNRSGVPLMELVTEPVIHSPEKAAAFATMLQMTLQYLGAASARMEWGEMRVEANISVSNTDDLGTKVEVKNLNSFKAVAGSIAYEIERQTSLLEKGESVVQETRGWNENTGKTVSQRLKETSEEYRYMPDPDIPSLVLGDVSGWQRDELLKTIPELPVQRMHRYADTVGIQEKHAALLVKNQKLGEIFDEALQRVDGDDAKTIANYLTSDVLQYEETVGDAVYERITGEVMAELVQMIRAGELSSRGAKDTIAVIAKQGGSPKAVAEQEGLFQTSDDDALTTAVLAVLEQNPAVVDEYRSGKEQVLQFLVGQVMKETKGSANPVRVQEIMHQKLSDG
ncbi:MAG: Asp-tRNA(Asn)/Glu-tRNA(Gln) amidotransferase subunit GatB [Candidatus Kaiserbacteria bacterium]|nr:Asp-tRNA(Asn)/Glu-tRNA(Gln) amidotransferase subunit GatB [Candidatus Kaiserbacteria bacterium]